jgi:PAS domain S-box-containing protein
LDLPGRPLTTWGDQLEDIHQVMVDFATEGLIYQEAGGQIKVWIFGRDQTPDQSWTSRFWDLISEDGSPCPDDQHPSKITLTTGRPLTNQVRGIKGNDGLVIWLSLNTRPVFDEGGGPPRAVIISFTDVTESKRAEEFLGADYLRQKIAMDLAKLVRWEYDAEADLFTFDEQFYALYGTSASEQGGNRMSSGEYARRFVPPEDRALVEKEIALSLAADDPDFMSQMEHRIIRADGQERFISVQYGIIKDETGRTIKTYGANQDITERRRAEDEFRRQRDRAEEYLEVVEAIIVALDRDGLVTLINRKGCELLGRQERDIIGRHWFSEFVPQPEGLETVFPIFKKITSGEMEGFDYFENDIITQGGSRRTVAWHNSYLLDEHGRIAGTLSAGEDITERKLAEEALRQSEEKYRLVVDNAAEVIAIFQDGTIKFANPRITEVFGYTWEQLASRTFADFIHPDDRPMVMKRYGRRMAGEEDATVHRWRIVRQDGRIRWLEVKTVTVAWEGRPAALSLITDITDHLAAERERDRLFDLSPDLLAVSGFDGFLRQLNPAWARTLGWTEGELLNRPWLDLVHPDDHSATVAAGGQLFAGVPVHGFENRYRCRDGSYRWLSWNSLPLVEEKLVFSVARDITDRKAMEKALRESQERFQMALQAAQVGVWDLDFRTLETVFSPTWYTMLGYEPDEFPSSFDAWLNLIHPDDRDRVLAAAQRTTGPGLENYNVKLRLRTRLGDYRWIKSQGRIMERDAEGRGVRMLGTQVDISDLKAVEEELRTNQNLLQGVLDVVTESEQRHRTLLESSPDPIVVYDLTGKATYVNRAFENTFGWSANEVLGSRIDFVPEEEQAETERAIERLFQEENNITLDCKRLTKDGRLRDVSLTASLFNDGTGRNAGCIVFLRDMTKRKRDEERLFQAAKMVSLGTLVSGIAHEINNPTNYILLNGEILAKVWDDVLPVLNRHQKRHGDLQLAGMPFDRAQGEIGKLISAISQGADRIRKIVQDLRTYSRRDSGELTEMVRVNEVIGSAESIVRSLIAKSTHRFSKRLAGNLPPVRGNRQKLEQVVINLLTNACQALERLDQELSLETSYDPEAGSVTIEVRDQGRGIPSHLLDQIMDPFFTTHRDTGTGLGLSITGGIVREHQGELKFDSAPGQGTTVTVVLPVAAEDLPGSGEGR